MHVPGWHEAIESLEIDDRIQVVGILQEQHPDRALLFMQWKEMDWPLLVDPLNLLEVPYVPITLAIDEHGIVRQVHPPLESPGDLLTTFVDKSYEGGEGPSGSAVAPDLKALRRAASRGTATDWRDYGDALLLWSGDRDLDAAIEAYRRAIETEPGDDATHFHLGVAYRMRFDSERHRPGDFAAAVAAWSRALEIDPNNYIWRRRIQQYGPRLAKPYSFYDWVTKARGEIEARGETPRHLAVEPGGAEFAYPAETFVPTESGSKDPDPEGRIIRDSKRFIRVETVVVPPMVAPGSTVRVHATFTPDPDIKAHWNNEVADLLFWVEESGGWTVEARRHTFPNPPQPVSHEVRKVEFEIRAPVDAAAGSSGISGYALYYVCEDVRGTCLYRRQDVSIPVEIGRPVRLAD